MMPKDNYDFLLAPQQLTAEDHPVVERLMLGKALPFPGATPPQDSGACFMPQGGHPWYLTAGHGLSLRQQLHQTVTWPATLNKALEGHPPDAYVFTRPAGVLLRHALDGFYEELERGTGSRFRLNTRPKTPPITLIDIDNVRSTSDIAYERRAMRALFDGAGHVCLIDNFAELGSSPSLELASDILYDAGVQAVTALRTILYKNINARDVLNPKTETSRHHAGFFKRVGKLCTQLEYDATVD